MRKSFNGLHYMIQKQFTEKELPGKFFLFLNKRKNAVKVYYWDKDGFAIWYKKLELGKFEFPKSNDKCVQISYEMIHQIFLGFSLKSSRLLKRFVL